MSSEFIEDWKRELADASTQRILYRKQIAFLLSRIEVHENLDNVLDDMKKVLPTTKLTHSEWDYDDRRVDALRSLTNDK